MSETNHPGIDYSGPGSTANRDKDTGIRYGVIAQNDLMGEALDDVFTHGDDLGYEAAKKEFKDKLRGVLEEYFSDHKYGEEKLGRLDRAVENAFDACDDWADGMDFNGPMFWQCEGYTLQADDHGDLWVFKSPYFTYAQFCSPCAPGACHLANPLEVKIQAGIASVVDGDNETFVDANKCYCLGHEYFEDKAPYAVYRVSDGSRVEKE